MDILEKIQKMKKEVRLAESAKDASRHYLSVLMSQNPMPDAPDGVSVRHIILMRNFRFYAAAFGVILMLGGTATSLAAERSLPGDALYPIKVGLTEPIRGALKVSESARTDWQIQKINRRFEEAEKLAALGRFNHEARQGIEKNFLAAGAEIEKAVTRGSSAEASRTASEVEAVLRAHSAVMFSMTNGSPGAIEILEESQKLELRALREQVNSTHHLTRDSRVRAEELTRQTSSSLRDAKEVVEKSLALPISGVVGFDAGSVLGEDSLTTGLSSAVRSGEAEDDPVLLMEAAGKKIKEGDYAAGLSASNRAVRKIKESEIIDQAEYLYGIKAEVSGNGEAGEVPE